MSLKRLIKIPSKSHCFLFGPRQVGKSTLLRETFNKAKTLYYNLLDPDTFFRLSQSRSAFLDDIKNLPRAITHVVVDEIQKLPELLDSVHYAIEELSESPYFILTGSSARKLKRSDANMLAGRAINLSMFPLVQEEFTEDAHYQEKFSLQKALEFGSLPKPCLDCDREQATAMLTSYVNIYLQEEIQQEALVRNIPAFSKFLRLSAEENANPLNFSKISKDIGVSANTIKDYYQILEDTLLGFRLEPFTNTLRKSISKSPKFYFFDIGVLRAITKEIHADLVPGTKTYGKHFEHYVIKEIIYTANYLNKGYEFFYYRTPDGVEVDLIIKTPDKQILAIEIKSSLSVDPKDLKALKSFARACPEAKLICIYRGGSLVTEKDGVRLVPLMCLKDLFIHEEKI